jgi:hypothetical protein
MNDRSAAWTDVGRLYNFIVDERDLWQTGPEGYLTTEDAGWKGDIVQLETNGDDVWDHSVIIVDLWQDGGGGMFYLVSGHTPDVDNYALDSFSYHQRRFIHIEQVDGFATYLPAVMRNR